MAFLAIKGTSLQSTSTTAGKTVGENSAAASNDVAITISTELHCVYMHFEWNPVPLELNLNVAGHGGIPGGVGRWLAPARLFALGLGWHEEPVGDGVLEFIGIGGLARLKSKESVGTAIDLFPWSRGEANQE